MPAAYVIVDLKISDPERFKADVFDVALNADVMAQYPFCRLSAPANVLVVPARHSASISVKLMQELAGATVIGPILSGINQPIQICSTNSTANDILNMAVLAAARLGEH